MVSALGRRRRVRQRQPPRLAHPTSPTRRYFVRVRGVLRKPTPMAARAFPARGQPSRRMKKGLLVRRRPSHVPSNCHESGQDFPLPFFLFSVAVACPGPGPSRPSGHTKRPLGSAPELSRDGWVVAQGAVEVVLAGRRRTTKHTDITGVPPDNSWSREQGCLQALA